MMIPLPTFAMVDVPMWFLFYLLGAFGVLSALRAGTVEFKLNFWYCLFFSLLYPMFIIIIWVNPELWEDSKEKERLKQKKLKSKKKKVKKKGVK